MRTSYKLLVTDIDNTIFDWVSYYVNSLETMLKFVEHETKIPLDTLLAEAKQIFKHHASIEYPFLLQEMPSIIDLYGENIDAMLNDLVEPARALFKKTALKYLHPYPKVKETLDVIKKKYPGLAVVALTDAPRYVAMWKLNKLGLLHEFNAIYGLADPTLPTDPKLGRVKVTAKILLKHLQQSNFEFKGTIRILPDEYEKPGTRGLKTVLMDYEYDELNDKRRRVIWIGDNLRKDIGLGHRVGVTSVWAKYGTRLDEELMARLNRFSPPDNVHRNVSLDPQSPEAPVPDYTLSHDLSELLPLLEASG